MGWLVGWYAPRVSVSYLVEVRLLLAYFFAYGQRWQAFRWYAPFLFAYRLAYHFCVPAYRSAYFRMYPAGVLLMYDSTIPH